MVYSKADTPFAPRSGRGGRAYGQSVGRKHATMHTTERPRLSLYPRKREGGGGGEREREREINILHEARATKAALVPRNGYSLYRGVRCGVVRWVNKRRSARARAFTNFVCPERSDRSKEKDSKKRKGKKKTRDVGGLGLRIGTNGGSRAGPRPV